jgi:hypothetical protein
MNRCYDTESVEGREAMELKPIGGDPKKLGIWIIEHRRSKETT